MRFLLLITSVLLAAIGWWLLTSGTTDPGLPAEPKPAAETPREADTAPVQRPITTFAPAPEASAALRAVEQPDAELTLRGVVRNPDGEALASVRLNLVLAEPFADQVLLGSSVAETLSETDGTFLISGVLRRGDRYALAASQADLGSWRSRLINPLRTQDLWQDVVLGHAGVVEGRVTNLSGAGVPQARVRDEADAARTVITDAEGRFRFTSVPPAGVRLRATATGLRSVVHQAMPGQLCMFELAPALAVCGRVLDAVTRQPVEHWRVTLRPTDGGDREFAEFTDKAGAFRFEGVEDGVLLLTAQDAAPRNVQAGAEGLVLEVRRGPVLTGEVLHTDGTPLRAARVALVPFAESGAAALPLNAWSAVDAQGRFSISAQKSGQWFVVAEGPDAARSAPVAVNVPGTVTLHLASGCIAHGIVRDERGDALAGVSVTFQRIVSQRAQPGGMPGMPPPGACSTVFTEEDGSFACTNLTIADYDLLLSHPSCVDHRIARVQVGSARHAVGEVRMARAAEVLVRVVDARGNGDATAVVLALHDDGERIVMSTGTDGSASRGCLRPGYWRFSVVQSAGVMRQDAGQRVELRAGQRATVRLEAQG